MQRRRRAADSPARENMLSDPTLSTTSGDLPQVTPERRPMWRGTDVLLMSVVMIVAVVIGIVVVAALSTAGGAQFGSGEVPPAFAVGTLAVQPIAMATGIWWMGLRRRGVTLADIGLRPISARWVAASVGIFIVMRIVVTIIALLLAQLGITSMQAQAIAPAGFTWVSAILTTLLAGIVIPFFEEIFFRGVVYRWLRDKWGVAVGIIVSGLVFGIVHLEPATVVPVIVMGFVLAWTYEKSGSLWPPILIHMLNNLLAVIALYAFLGTGGTLTAP
jgi:membrane protease YdiL (CAAX protease family)